MDKNTTKIEESEVEEVREGLIRDAAGLLRDAHGRILPGQRAINPKGRDADILTIPDNATLDDVLVSRLGKKGAVRLADALIGLATGSKPVLQAIQYIYDRLEGKPRQAVVDTKDATPAFVEAMREFYAHEEQQSSQQPARSLEPTKAIGLPAPNSESYIEAELREILSEEIEAEL